jgi:hypothetical protein
MSSLGAELQYVKYKRHSLNRSRSQKAGRPSHTVSNYSVIEVDANGEISRVLAKTVETTLGEVAESCGGMVLQHCASVVLRCFASLMPCGVGWPPPLSYPYARLHLGPKRGVEEEPCSPSFSPASSFLLREES